MGLLKGGEIVWHQEGEDLVFPLGVKDGSSLKDKTGDSVCDPELNEKKEALRSHFTADVDASGNADNFAFHFAQESTGEKFDIFGQEYEICSQLEVTNAAQVEGSVSGKALTLDPGPAWSRNFVIKTKPQGQVTWVCRSEVAQDTHTGLFAPPKDLGEEKQEHDWNLTHEPDTEPFFVDEVLSTTECPSFVADDVNNRYGFPTTGEADFKWAVYDCDVKECNGEPEPQFDPPNDTSIKGLLKGGEVVWHQEGEDLVFPLGVKDGSSLKDKTGDSVCDPELNEKKEALRSHFTADVDASGDADNFAFHFAQSSTGEKFDVFGQEYEICSQLEVTSPALVEGSVSGTAWTLNPGPMLRTNFDIKTKPQGQVTWTCRSDIPQNTHSGEFSEPKDLGEEKQDHDWNLTHQPDTEPFFVDEVESTTECPSFVANELNGAYGLPTTGEADFKWAVYDCSLKDCSTITGHPNK